MKKIFIFVILSILLTNCNSIQNKTLKKMFIHDKDYAFLRSYPSIHAPIMIKISSLTEIGLLKSQFVISNENNKSFKWNYVSFGDYKGWMQSNKLKEYQLNATYLYVSGTLHVTIREENSITSRIIKVIPKGTKVILVNKKGNIVNFDDKKAPLFMIKYGRYTGWVFSAHLSEKKPKIIKRHKDSINNYFNRYISKRGGVYLHKTFSAKSSKVSFIPYRKKIKIIQKKNEWFEIQDGIKHGWVRNKNISIFDPLYNVDLDNQNSSVYSIAINGLRIRKGPTLKSQIITVIKYGDAIHVTRITDLVKLKNIYGKWAKVEYNGKKGWLFDFYTSKIEPKPLYKVKYLYVTAKSGISSILEYNFSNYIYFKFGTRVEFLNSIDKIYANVRYKGIKYKVVKNFLNKNKMYINNYTRLRKFLVKKYRYPSNIAINKISWFYLVHYIGRDQAGGSSMFSAIWTNQKGFWKKLYGKEWAPQHPKLLHINNDKYIDMIITGGCCGGVILQIYIGTSNNYFKHVFDGDGREGSKKFLKKYYPYARQAPDIVSLGKCGKTVIKYDDNIWTFNCQSNSFEIKK